MKVCVTWNMSQIIGAVNESAEKIIIGRGKLLHFNGRLAITGANKFRTIKPCVFFRKANEIMFALKIINIYL